MTPVPTKWRKCSLSGEETNCVELACVDSRVTIMRDSKNPAGPMLNVDLNELLDVVTSPP